MVIFLIDADNLCATAWVEEALEKLARSEGPLGVKRAYGSAEKLKALTSTMRDHAIRPFVNLSLTKNTTDVALAVDAMELSWQLPTPHTVVIGSGDADFVPLVVRLRERGIRTVCVSDFRKMAPEARSAYDEVYLVGENTPADAAASRPEPARRRALKPSPAAVTELQMPTQTVNAPAKKAATKKVAAKKTVTKTVAPAAAPSHPPPANNKKVGAKKAVKKNANAVAPPAADRVTGREPSPDVVAILNAVPALASGSMQPLNAVVKGLHDAKILGKNSSSIKLFRKLHQAFELSPENKPDKVRYLVT